MLDARIPVSICLQPEMTTQISERRSGGTGTPSRALVLADANLFLLWAWRQSWAMLEQDWAGASTALSAGRVSWGWALT